MSGRANRVYNLRYRELQHSARHKQVVDFDQGVAGKETACLVIQSAEEHVGIYKIDSQQCPQAYTSNIGATPNYSTIQRQKHTP